MKKKKLALLLAVAMSVTSIDSTAMIVNAADFTSEDVQEHRCRKHLPNWSGAV